jgi:hypothetical protein
MVHVPILASNAQNSRRCEVAIVVTDETAVAAAIELFRFVRDEAADGRPAFSPTSCRPLGA